MVLLDTTFLSDLIRRRPQAVKALEEMQERSERLSTSTINLAELYGGVFRLPEPAGHLESVERLVEVLILLVFDARAARTFGELDAHLAAQVAGVPAKDLLIASMALSHGEHEVLTRNQKDFGRVPGIRVRSY
jgi:predicted nucleic acid-binding protein